MYALKLSISMFNQLFINKKTLEHGSLRQNRDMEYFTQIQYIVISTNIIYKQNVGIFQQIMMFYNRSYQKSLFGLTTTILIARIQRLHIKQHQQVFLFPTCPCVCLPDIYLPKEMLRRIFFVQRYNLRMDLCYNIIICRIHSVI